VFHFKKLFWSKIFSITDQLTYRTRVIIFLSNSCYNFLNSCYKRTISLEKITEKEGHINVWKMQIIEMIFVQVMQPKMCNKCLKSESKMKCSYKCIWNYGLWIYIIWYNINMDSIFKLIIWYHLSMDSKYYLIIWYNESMDTESNYLM